MWTALITLLSLNACLLEADVLPEGTQLEVRFSAATGSRISHAGDSVEATVIAPVFADGRMLISQGAVVRGTVASVDRVGLGIKHLTSRIEYQFDKLQLSDGSMVPVNARVADVETAKERVDPEGMIGGIHPTANLSSSVAFYGIPLLYFDPEFGVPMMGIKVLIARSPDPEIYFPAGTEMILKLTGETNVPEQVDVSNGIPALSPARVDEVRKILAKLPEQRTNRGRNKPSDLVNIVLLGDRASIGRAFEAAGWSGAQRTTLRSIYRMYHCMVQRIGYSMAPMGRMMLNGVPADAEYQKNLNTFSKRHHLRLWKDTGEDAWISAATEDVGYTLHGVHLTHATDSLIDSERAKVLNDLAYTGCVSGAAMMARPLSDGGLEGGASIQTDGRVAIVQVSDCQHPRASMNESGRPDSPEKPRAVQALLAMRNDLIRSNPISLAYNTTKLLREHERAAELKGFVASPTSKGKAETSGRRQAEWLRPSVLDGTVPALVLQAGY